MLYYIADPARQLMTYGDEEMKRCWIAIKAGGEEKGAALALEPGPDFYDTEDERDKVQRTGGLTTFFKYLSPYRKEFFHLILGMITVSLLQLIFPFLTQSLVDVGVRDSNLNFITLILVAQLIVTVSMLSVEFIP